MLNSVQLYFKSFLDGLPVGNGQTLTTYIVPPPVDDLDGPRGYVWASRMRGARQTMPRGAGFKKLGWNVDVYLSYETVPDEVDVDQQFPLIVDAVLWKLSTVVMPTFITDPTTERQSQILSIGEEFELENPPERVPATLRMLYFMARIGFQVYEAVQG